MNKSTLLDLCDKSIVPAVKWNSIYSYNGQMNVLILKYLLEKELDFKISYPHEDSIYIRFDKNDIINLSLQESSFIPEDWRDSQFEHILSHGNVKTSIITNATYYLPNLETLEKLNGEDWY
jgi:hypothetical protein